MSGDDAERRVAKVRETGNERLRRVVAPGGLDVRLVSVLAGDSDPRTGEREALERYRRSRGALFFSDVLYAISHHYFAPEVAQALWEKVLRHKSGLSLALGRDVGITVATLDYLSNIEGGFEAQTLISENDVSSLASLAMRDGLTGLYNHTTFYELLDLELRNHKRYGVGVCVLLLDVDDFKLINDALGHQEGDRLLVELARLLEDEARSSDICCRLGGDEFAVILRLTNDPDEAVAIAARVRDRVATMDAEHPWSVSIGIAMCHSSHETPQELVQRADAALYQGKAAGKNRVVLNEDPS